MIEAAVLHSCHWTVSEGLDYATRMKHAKANYLTSILEGNDLQPAVTRFDAVIDSVIAQLDLDVTNSEIRYFN